MNNNDFDKSHWNTNGKHWFPTVIPETFHMGFLLEDGLVDGGQIDGIDYKIFIYLKRAEVIKHELSCKILY